MAEPDIPSVVGSHSAGCTTAPRGWSGLGFPLLVTLFFRRRAALLLRALLVVCTSTLGFALAYGRGTT